MSPGVQILSISCSFLGKFGKIICWRPPESWRLHLGEILDPPLTGKSKVALQSQGGHGTGKTGNLVLTFSRQGKHREFCFDTGKIFETQGKYFFVTQGKI